MKTATAQYAKKTAKVLYGKPIVRRAYEGALKTLLSPARDAASYPSTAAFTKDDGQSIPLLDGLRSHTNPSWPIMANPVPPTLPSSADLATKSARCAADIAELSAMLHAHGFALEGKRALEIGCFDGIHSHHLAAATRAEVTASDIAKYYDNERDGDQLTDASATAKNSFLDEIRNHCKSWLDTRVPRPGAVTFVEDDISSTTLDDGSFDLICSWEVLEHVASPARSLANMHRLLRSGGYCYHDYNPFFSLNGGHSLGSLDFHWGHARVSDTEFDRYVDTLRPNESAQDKTFFHHSLNRMTLAALREDATATGFEVLTLLPWPNQHHRDLVEPEALAQVQQEHPSAEHIDLICPRVTVVLRKL